MDFAPHFAPHWEAAAAAAALFAVVAKAARAVTWGGAVAGFATGACVAAGFGPPGLIVLGAFFVAGTLATKAGYAKKAARGAAEKRGGARGWENVVGKGGVAAALALAAVAGTTLPLAFAGAVAAALADTLGTEIGSLSRGRAWRIPRCVAVAHGTPGAVSIVGLGGAMLGALLVTVVASAAGLSGTCMCHTPFGAIVLGGFAGSLAESLAVGVAPGVARTPGWIRNVLTTAAGATLAQLAEGALGP